MLPRDSPSSLTQIKIAGFENALEDALPDSRDIDRLYTIERAYQQNTLDLVDALEQTCLILMRDPMLLEAFMDIPRYDYQFDIQVDQSFDLWLRVSTRQRKTIRRRLGGGFAEDSGECLLCLPQYADIAAELLRKIPETSEDASPSDNLSLSSPEPTVPTKKTSPTKPTSACRPVSSHETILFVEKVSSDEMAIEEEEVEELLQLTCANAEEDSSTIVGFPALPEERPLSSVPRDDRLGGDTTPIKSRSI
ncbi:hypothetical protein Clacol_000006 [Clathrus columnatus]|uniref:Uncharacterized protein n=1 Tax=Clathrus columnatus TaxID=1419009 RepID=A0AAV4ZW51_9AGAM|nr:hypothetical protein Clacol_000006 [Clathrus columnatus]